MLENTIEVLEKNKCMGCEACFNICPKDAITMNEGREGFLYPTIDINKCIKCGMCKASCPALGINLHSVDDRECFAVMANDNIRMMSSSGGLFSLLSEYIIRKGGYVCGAAWENDWSVRHKLIHSVKELDELRRSKYVASIIGDNYKKIKELLDGGCEVLFSGSPCQVAGLEKFLGKQYDNLLLIDIVCHGVPSPKAFRKYLNEIADGRKIKNINFRDKSRSWGTYIDITFENGEIYHNDCYHDPFWVGFLNATTPRISCSTCPFAKFDRIGDISLGDFWGIGKYYENCDDNKGTGLVLINTRKGRYYFEKIIDQLKLSRKIENQDVMEIAKGHNAQLVAPHKAHRGRKRFFDLLDYMEFSKALKDANSRRFDVAIMGWWYSENYGSALTYYALHQLVLSLGLSPLMIERPIPEGEEKVIRCPNNISRRFAKKHYEISKLYHPSELRWINECCKTFISGSDQLFNYYMQFISGPSFYLDFVAPYNNIISYASSFGNDYYGDEKAILQSAYLLKRFKSLSVRESYAVDICKNKFGLEATCVLDPVFMIEQSEYDKIVDQAKIKIDGGYIAAFILDPDENKTNLIKWVSEQMELPVHCLIDAVNIPENKAAMKLDYIYDNADVEDWLSIMSGAKFIITDSFHGTCFSIIFKKRFISLANYKRGAQRFESLLTQFEILDRLIYDINDVYTKQNVFSDIDYTHVFEIIEHKREYSLQWLKHAIFDPIEVNATSDEFHVVDYQLTVLKEEIQKLQRKLDEELWQVREELDQLKM